VANGGADKKASHSWRVWPQRYAYDLVMAANHPESRSYGDDRVKCKAKDIRGNYIALKHGEIEFSTAAQLMPGSVTVALGPKVVRGQVTAKCGYSGNTSEPHVHFQLNDLKCIHNGKRGATHPAEYIAKGQLVENGRIP